MIPVKVICQARIYGRDSCGGINPGDPCQNEAFTVGRFGHDLCFAHYMAEKNEDRSEPVKYQGPPNHPQH